MSGLIGQKRVPTAAWFREVGPDLDVVVSTRCRLARNVEGYPFPHHASKDVLTTAATLCRQAVANTEPLATAFDREKLTADVLRELIVARFVSFRWAVSQAPGPVYVSPSGQWSAMIHEEDHLRIQAICAGLDARTAQSLAHKVEEGLRRRLPLAWREGLGFLTASLSNTGTGERVSFLLHIPVLAQEPSFIATLAAAEQMGCSIRGAFGEGTAGTGGLVQLSNRCTFGQGAVHAVDRAVGAAQYLVAKEREARGALLAHGDAYRDLKAAIEGARWTLIHEEPEPAEMLRCVSVLRLGIALGVTPGDILRTGEWIALAGVALWARLQGRSTVERFESLRSLARIRAGIRHGNASTDSPVDRL